MMNPPLRLLTAFQQHHPEPPMHLLHVPGREMWVAAALGYRHFFTLLLPDRAAALTFDARSARRMCNWAQRPAPAQFRYVLAAARWLDWEGLLPAGGRIVIAGDEPPGPRYQHALGMAFITLSYAHHARPLDEAHLLSLMERMAREMALSLS